MQECASLHLPQPKVPPESGSKPALTSYQFMLQANRQSQSTEIAGAEDGKLAFKQPISLAKACQPFSTFSNVLCFAYFSTWQSIVAPITSFEWQPNSSQLPLSTYDATVSFKIKEKPGFPTCSNTHLPIHRYSHCCAHCHHFWKASSLCQDMKPAGLVSLRAAGFTSRSVHTYASALKDPRIWRTASFKPHKQPKRLMTWLVYLVRKAASLA